jgi:hypothetical protein
LPKKLERISIRLFPSLNRPSVSKPMLSASLLRYAHGTIKPIIGIKDRIILAILSFVPATE